MPMSREVPAVGRRYLFGVARYLSTNGPQTNRTHLILFAVVEGLRAPSQAFISVRKVVNGCR
jgi:hypothetical protein